MEFYRVWRILAGYRWLLIWLPIIATCAGLGLTYVLPEMYESTALVVVRPFEEIRFSADNGAKRELPDFPVNLSAPVDAPSKTYIEVIKSPAVAVEIVDALQLQVPKPKHFESEFDVIKDDLKTWIKNTFRTVQNYVKYGRDIPASPMELAVENLERNLVVAARKDTYAFDITYRSSDAAEAAAVANMAAQIFLQRSSEAYRSESARAREFIETQLEESRKALDQARAALLSYKTSGGTFELSTEYNETLKNEANLENTLAKSEGKLAGLKTRNYVKGSPDVIEQEAETAELKDQISTLRAKLAAYPRKETQLNAIILTERLAEQSYEFFLKQYQEAHVKEAATISEIRTVSRAEPGLYPVKPLKYLYAGMSFAFALIVTISWALLSEAFDPRVRTTSDLDGEFGLPVLGAIPTLKRSWRMAGTQS